MLLLGEDITLWLAIVASGLLNGLNPATGWPLAVIAATLFEGRPMLWRVLGALALVHLVLASSALLPFDAIFFLFDWSTHIQVAGIAVLAAAVLWWLSRRPLPSLPARVPFWQLSLAAVPVVTAYGSPSMLVQFYIGLCQVSKYDPGKRILGEFMTLEGSVPIIAAWAYTVALLVTGSVLAFALYRWLEARGLAEATLWRGRLALGLAMIGSLGLAGTV
ncbi:MAG: hypothetical protein AAGI34_08300 [Pseudomonadota bacterium]